jgi:ribosomal protein S18
MSEDLKIGMGGRMPDKDSAAETGGKFRGKKRRKVSYLTLNKIESVDYKDVSILRRFVNESNGKMLSSRQTGNTRVGSAPLRGDRDGPRATGIRSSPQSPR